jgi:hypothetical protein
MQVRLNRFIFCFFFLTFNIILGNTYAQTPVSWKFSGKKVNGGTEITAIAEIQQGWVIYGQTMVEEGPVPTTFSIGGKEIRFEEITKPVISTDELFELKLEKFSGRAVFKYILQNYAAGDVRGEVRYMTCDGQKCLPPAKVQFDLKAD